MIPLRDAIILWDADLKKVMIKPKGHKDTPEMVELKKSGGAAYGFWQEAPASELYFRMLQQFTSMVRDDGIPASKVHDAFLDIPEYRATLRPCAELDEMKDNSWPVELPEGWSSGYSF